MKDNLIRAMYQKHLPDGRVQCLLCPHECRLKDNHSGICGVRRNISGELRSLNWGLVSSAAIDPIEKKPLYNYCPGSSIVSFGTFGCSFRCRFCQNWSISHLDNDQFNTYRIGGAQTVEPDYVVKAARSSGVDLVAFTYSEPVVWFEFVLEASKACRSAGLKTVLVTNGFINQEPLQKLLPYVDAMNVDIKSMDDEFYRRFCTGRVKPVLATCESASKAGVHIEITNLVIPTLNDSDENFRALSDFVCQSLGSETPVHFSRYRPCFRMQIPPTPVDTLYRARDIAKKNLRYVYLGNI